MVKCRITTLIHSLEHNQTCFNPLLVVEGTLCIDALVQRALSLYARKADTDAANLKVLSVTTPNAGYEAAIEEQDATVSDALGSVAQITIVLPSAVNLLAYTTTGTINTSKQLATPLSSTSPSLDLETIGLVSRSPPDKSNDHGRKRRAKGIQRRLERSQRKRSMPNKADNAGDLLHDDRPTIAGSEMATSRALKVSTNILSSPMQKHRSMNLAGERKPVVVDNADIATPIAKHNQTKMSDVDKAQDDDGFNFTSKKRQRHSQVFSPAKKSRMASLKSIEKPDKFDADEKRTPLLSSFQGMEEIQRSITADGTSNNSKLSSPALLLEARRATADILPDHSLQATMIPQKSVPEEIFGKTPPLIHRSPSRDHEHVAQTSIALQKQTPAQNRIAREYESLAPVSAGNQSTKLSDGSITCNMDSNAPTALLFDSLKIVPLTPVTSDQAMCLLTQEKNLDLPVCPLTQENLEKANQENFMSATSPAQRASGLRDENPINHTTTTVPDRHGFLTDQPKAPAPRPPNAEQPGQVEVQEVAETSSDSVTDAELADFLSNRDEAEKQTMADSARNDEPLRSNQISISEAPQGLEATGYHSASSSMRSGKSSSDSATDSSSAESVSGDKPTTSVGPVVNSTFREISASTPTSTQDTEPRPEPDDYDRLLKDEDNPESRHSRQLPVRPGLKAFYRPLSTLHELSQRKKDETSSQDSPSRDSEKKNSILSTAAHGIESDDDGSPSPSSNQSSITQSDHEASLPEAKRASGTRDRVKKRQSEGARALLMLE